MCPWAVGKAGNRQGEVKAPTKPISTVPGLWVAIMASEKHIQYIDNVHTMERVTPSIPASFGRVGQGLQVVSH